MNEILTLTPTQDGSLTLFDAGTHQHYHNRAGAFTEALKNYVLPSNIISTSQHESEIRLLDVCYGLGYNSWVLINTLLKERIQKNIKKPMAIHINAIEANPLLFSLSTALLEQPCYHALQEHCQKDFEQLTQAFDTIATAKENHHTVETPFENNLTVYWHIATQDLRKVVPTLQQGAYELIFHDPFSPNKMPELWTSDLFKHYFSLLKPTGAMLTYSLAAAVRAGLLEAGFQLYKSEAVGDKAGGTLAFKDTPQHLEMLFPAFSDEEFAYLETRAGIPYRDLSGSDNREDILSRREIEQAASKRKSGSEFKKSAAAFS